MRQTNEEPAHATLQRDSSDSLDPWATPDLSDRQAVIAVMVANGLSCKDIAVRLSLPLRTVQGHLQRALEILDLSDASDLTYVIVASHYNRNSPAVTCAGQSRGTVSSSAEGAAGWSASAPTAFTAVPDD